LLSQNRILAQAREVGFCERERKLKPGQLLWGLMSALSTPQTQGITGLYRAYVFQTQKSLSMSSFHERLNRPSTALWLKSLYEQVRQELYAPLSKALPGFLERFQDIWAYDGTSYSVLPHLKDVYPGTFGYAAGVELHMAYSLKERQFKTSILTGASASEVRVLPEGLAAAEAGTLILLDRAFVDLPRLSELSARGLFYVVRGKANLNPVVAGKKLKTQNFKAGKDYDLRAEFGTGTEVRLLLLWNPKRKRHTSFLSNLTLEQATAQEMGALYRLRWQVECAFKQLKSFCNLQCWPSWSPAICESLIWASLLLMHLKSWLLLLSESRSRLSGLRVSAMGAFYMPELAACAVRCFTGLPELLRAICKQIEYCGKIRCSTEKEAYAQCEDVFKLRGKQGVVGV
jgi:hypothetical protein